ncbi:HVA1 family protein [Nostoc sp. B(2019)]|nr:HVA1 family protein [Nostoc sp. B(2019)]
MTEQFKKGDKVEWNTAQGKTTGKVVKKLTSPTDIKGHHVAASEDNPEYLVESDNTGKQAAHKPDALKKVEE